MNAYCPVCWRQTRRTPNGNIRGHYDTALTLCPASFEPFHITISHDDMSDPYEKVGA